MFVLETCLKCDPNALEMCLKRGPNMLEMWSKHAPELQFLKLGNTACSFLKHAWNMIQTCSRIALNVISTHEFCNWVTQHVHSWNLLEMWSKRAPELQFPIDAISRGCVSSTGIFPADPEKTILPKFVPPRTTFFPIPTACVNYFLTVSILNTNLLQQHRYAFKK
jgi:hypothetical protein